MKREIDIEKIAGQVVNLIIDHLEIPEDERQEPMWEDLKQDAMNDLQNTETEAFERSIADALTEEVIIEMTNMALREIENE